ncbi:MAG: hypothetical protein J6N19_17880 [Clostridium sp.]|nr:hypothetical protein [Clostridium sp.]
MDIGDLLTAVENHIYSFAKKQFDINNISPSMQRLIMEAVFSKFQAEAIAEMILNQISYEGEDTPDKQIDQTKETVEDMVDTLREFYNNEEGKNGGTEDSSAQA